MRLLCACLQLAACAALHSYQLTASSPAHASQLAAAALELGAASASWDTANGVRLLARDEVRMPPTPPHATTLPLRASPHLSSPLLTSPHLTSPHLSSPLLSSPLPGAGGRRGRGAGAGRYAAPPQRDR